MRAGARCGSTNATAGRRTAEERTMPTLTPVFRRVIQACRADAADWPRGSSDDTEVALPRPAEPEQRAARGQDVDDREHHLLARHRRPRHHGLARLVPVDLRADLA